MFPPVEQRPVVKPFGRKTRAFITTAVIMVLLAIAFKEMYPRRPYLLQWYDHALFDPVPTMEPRR